MPLRDIDLSPSDDPIPADVARFIREADRRIEVFQDGCRVPGFVPSDYSAGYRVLRAVAESGLTRGRRFCEWGSGFGVVACLAAMLDFDACGVEIEGELVDAARQLADDFGLPVEFIRGSFIPKGGDPCQHTTEEFAWLTPDESTTHEELALGP